MLTIQGLTVRLGGRDIIERASAAIPPRGKVGLIGRNGAGKSTLVKAIIGEIEPDEGEIDMPRGMRLGYIAQEAPSGTATPFDTVLAADVERLALLEESETCTDPDRLGDLCPHHALTLTFIPDGEGRQVRFSPEDHPLLADLV